MIHNSVVETYIDKYSSSRCKDTNSITSLDVHFEAIHDHGDSGDACVDVGCGQGALVDGAELPHDPVEEEEIVRTHPDSGSEIQRED